MCAGRNYFWGYDLTAIHHDYASVNGVRLHYAHAGQGPLILFLGPETGKPQGLSPVP